MKFKCSLCNYLSYNKLDVNRHFNRKIKCGEGIPTILTVDETITCDDCKKIFTLEPNLKRHLKTCKFKKINLDNSVKILESRAIVELDKEIKYLKKIDELEKKYNKINNSFKSLLTLIDNKLLGNTNIKAIRAQSRQKYKNFSKSMNCVHCNHSGSTQVCHIKPISEFNKSSTVEEINKLTNLIGLCPNCHIDLDKHKKFEVVRTSKLHSLIVNKLLSTC